MPDLFEAKFGKIIVAAVPEATEENAHGSVLLH